jgi:hypothetical protein
MDDDEEIQPTNTLDLSPQNITLVKDTWISVKAMGVTKVGLMFFKNLFRINP